MPPLCPIGYSLFDPTLYLDLPVYEVSDQAATPKAGDNWQGKGNSRKTQAHTSDENYRLETFTKNGDEGQDEHCVFLTPELEADAEIAALLGLVLDFERFGELDPPLVLKFGDTE